MAVTLRINLKILIHSRKSVSEEDLNQYEAFAQSMKVSVFLRVSSRSFCWFEGMRKCMSVHNMDFVFTPEVWCTWW